MRLPSLYVINFICREIKWGTFHYRTVLISEIFESLYPKNYWGSGGTEKVPTVDLFPLKLVVFFLFSEESELLIRVQNLASTL